MRSTPSQFSILVVLLGGVSGHFSTISSGFLWNFTCCLHAEEFEQVTLAIVGNRISRSKVYVVDCRVQDIFADHHMGYCYPRFLVLFFVLISWLFRNAKFWNAHFLCFRPPRRRLATSVQAGERLYRQTMSLRRTANGDHALACAYSVVLPFQDILNRIRSLPSSEDVVRTTGPYGHNTIETSMNRHQDRKT